MTALGWQLCDSTHLEDGHAKYALSFLKENNKLEKKILRTFWTAKHGGLIFSAHSAVGGRKSETHKCGLGGKKSRIYFWQFHLLDASPGISFLASLYLGFLMYIMGMLIT